MQKKNLQLKNKKIKKIKKIINKNYQLNLLKKFFLQKKKNKKKKL
jgi:hypothetical protein